MRIGRCVIALMCAAATGAEPAIRAAQEAAEERLHAMFDARRGDAADRLREVALGMRLRGLAARVRGITTGVSAATPMLDELFASDPELAEAIEDVAAREGGRTPHEVLVGFEGRPGVGSGEAWPEPWLELNAQIASFAEDALEAAERPLDVRGPALRPSSVLRRSYLAEPMVNFGISSWSLGEQRAEGRALAFLAEGAAQRGDFVTARRALRLQAALATALAETGRGVQGRGSGISMRVRGCLKTVDVTRAAARAEPPRIDVIDRLAVDALSARPDIAWAFEFRRARHLETVLFVDLQLRSGVRRSEYRFTAPMGLVTVHVPLAEREAVREEAARVFDLWAEACLGPVSAMEAAEAGLAMYEPYQWTSPGETVLAAAAGRVSPFARFEPLLWGHLDLQGDLMALEGETVRFWIAFERAALAAIAIERYRAVHGDLPASLEVAVGELDAAVRAVEPDADRHFEPDVGLSMDDLRDPWAPGERIRFRPEPTFVGGYAVYSVGADGVDDGLPMIDPRRSRSARYAESAERSDEFLIPRWPVID